jgi:hypothetical protein
MGGMESDLQLALDAKLDYPALRLAGRAWARLLATLGIPLSRHSAAPAMAARAQGWRAAGAGVDDFALRRGQVYATVLISAETGQRVDVLAGRKADGCRPGYESIPAPRLCRDGSGTYAEATRRALPASTPTAASPARQAGRRTGIRRRCRVFRDMAQRRGQTAPWAASGCLPRIALEGWCAGP